MTEERTIRGVVAVAIPTPDLLGKQQTISNREARGTKFTLTNSSVTQ